MDQVRLYFRALVGKSGSAPTLSESVSSRSNRRARSAPAMPTKPGARPQLRHEGRGGALRQLAHGLRGRDILGQVEVMGARLLGGGGQGRGEIRRVRRDHRVEPLEAGGERRRFGRVELAHGVALALERIERREIAIRHRHTVVGGCVKQGGDHPPDLAGPEDADVPDLCHMCLLLAASAARSARPGVQNGTGRRRAERSALPDRGADSGETPNDPAACQFTGEVAVGWRRSNRRPKTTEVLVRTTPGRAPTSSMSTSRSLDPGRFGGQEEIVVAVDRQAERDLGEGFEALEDAARLLLANLEKHQDLHRFLAGIAAEHHRVTRDGAGALHPCDAFLHRGARDAETLGDGRGGGARVLLQGAQDAPVSASFIVLPSLR